MDLGGINQKIDAEHFSGDVSHKQEQILSTGYSEKIEDKDDVFSVLDHYYSNSNYSEYEEYVIECFQPEDHPEPSSSHHTYLDGDLLQVSGENQGSSLEGQVLGGEGGSRDEGQYRQGDFRTSIGWQTKIQAFKTFKIFAQQQYQQFMKPKRGRPKMPKQLTKTLEHFWRDTAPKFKHLLEQKLKADEQVQLVKMVKAIFQETKSERKQNKKWYSRLSMEESLLPYIMEMLEQREFDKLMQKLKVKDVEVYRRNRIPVLVMFSEQLSEKEYRKFRNYYHLYKATQQ